MRIEITDMYRTIYVGAWAGRPSASAAGAGACIYISTGNMSGTEWISDGTNWRPRGGRQLVANRNGHTSAPIVTFTSTASGLAALTLPVTPVISAGAIVDRTNIEFWAIVRRLDALGGNAFPRITFGTSATSGDSQINATTSAAQNSDSHLQSSARFSSDPSKAYSPGWISPNQQGVSSITTVATNINTNADMYMGISVNAPAANVQFALYGYGLEIVGR